MTWLLFGAVVAVVVTALVLAVGVRAARWRATHRGGPLCRECGHPADYHYEWAKLAGYSGGCEHLTRVSPHVRVFCDCGGFSA